MTLFETDATPVGPAGPTVRIRLTVAYDGAGFHGFAVNDGVSTVGGLLTQALSTILRHPVEITCAGRTDKGVHAFGQVIHFDTTALGVDLDALVVSINKMCAPGVAVRDAAQVDDAFDARFSAEARRYRYRIHCAPTPDPFTARYAWHIDAPLSLPAMVLACDPLIGEHDFSAFCRRPKRRDGGEASLVRRVTEAVWHDDGDGFLRFEIEASSFCHQMVRSVVGTMIAVGRRRRTPGELMGIIGSRDRSRASELAPPHGLTLLTVRYPDWASVPDRR